MNADKEGKDLAVDIWPQSLAEFLSRRLRGLFCVKAYVLDPQKCEMPEKGMAQPQALPNGSEPIEGDPLQGLIRIDEISAQRGFGHADGTTGSKNEADASASSSRGKLSEQLRAYYKRHLDPLQNPQVEDLQALGAIKTAQTAFDERLRDGFAPALNEVQNLGYPGVTDPRLVISTRLRPIDGLSHDSAVQYVVEMLDGEDSDSLCLPEDSNGLGYQNLISMVFRLMSFRDAWMKVGKADGGEEAAIPPIHIVLIEEPEAHLHTQVQQVFIRQAYEILRGHVNLERDSRFTTQLVVSTHSSHLAHECDFASLRYFRRIPAGMSEVPTSTVVSLAEIFGDDVDTERFVTRYLKVAHCDLLFADAAVLIEGSAERILVPYFLRQNDEFSDLLECYITWLEIGGSHAHRLRSLIESLGLTTLIITDLDATDENGKTIKPLRGSKQKTRNMTLKSWCPETESLDDLLDKTPDEKQLPYPDQHFAIRVAYQCPVRVSLNGVNEEALSYTFEDALVFQNLDTFKSLPGVGLRAKFRDAIENSRSSDELGQSLFEALKTGDKAVFALDLLEIEESKILVTPDYIRDGLLWLKDQLRHNQEELGVAIQLEAPASDVKAEV